VAEPERPWRQASPADLRAQIEAATRARRRGRHARPSSRHAFIRPSRRRSQRSAFIRYPLLFATTAVLVLVLRNFVIASFYIPSASMEPTLHGCPTCEPDRVMVDKLSYRFSSVGRKDVIVFDRPPKLPVNDQELIKRVIGLPGETVSAHAGKVYIGNTPLNEPYVNPRCQGTVAFAPVIIPPRQYFVMGDNRCDSSDSRVFGPIRLSSIVGRAFAVVWPVKRMHGL
jgi:signal peptidase I